MYELQHKKINLWAGGPREDNEQPGYIAPDKVLFFFFFLTKILIFFIFFMKTYIFGIH